jgi:hypothetical protein
MPAAVSGRTLVLHALVSLNKRRGSSRTAIRKVALGRAHSVWNATEQKHVIQDRPTGKPFPMLLERTLRIALRRLVDAGEIVQIKQSFRLAPKRAKKAKNPKNAERR